MTTGVALASGERRLEDEIFHLQKLDLAPPVRQVVEEASQLFTEGRHMEAAALMEKAAAMRSVAGGGKPPRTSGATDAAGSVADILVTDLARGLAEVLAKTVRDLEEHLAAETRALGRSIEQRLDAAAAAIERVAARHESEIDAVRAEVRELKSSLTERVDALCARVEVEHQGLGALQSAVDGVSPRVNALVERLDRQAGAIRSMHEAETLREDALDQLGEVLAKLKASNPRPESVETQL